MSHSLDKTDLYSFIFTVFNLVTWQNPIWVPGKIFYNSTIKGKEIFINIRSINSLEVKSLIKSLHHVSNYIFMVEIEHLIISKSEIKIQFESVNDFDYIRHYNYPCEAWDCPSNGDYSICYEEIIPDLSEVRKIF
jgi:hypothetical protein